MLTWRVPILADEILEGDGSDLAQPHIQAVLHSHPQQIHQLPLHMLELHNAKAFFRQQLSFMSLVVYTTPAEHICSAAQVETCGMPSLM